MGVEISFGPKDLEELRKMLTFQDEPVVRGIDGNPDITPTEENNMPGEVGGSDAGTENVTPIS